ncbi:MAG: GTP 3',8-cyclase MoaA [Anaerolineae bacterium]|nr:GTP 3',8-cyclase MoaA [Anaerolineae bacterium]
MSPHDSLQRAIRYLRVSVTDRCNLRCRYCMPEEGVPTLRHEDILRHEEIARIVAVAASLGLSKVRLTGGEPLVRKGLLDLVRMIAQTPGIDELAMTTNGTLLAPQAQSLADAGLQRVNISLDTLRAERFRDITRWGELEDVLEGIRAAHAAGLEPVKINMVVMRGFNDDEVVDMARQSLNLGWHVRFIEVMPLGENAWFNQARYVSSGEVRARIEAAWGPLEPASLPGNGPARYWRVPGAPGSLGFISAISEHFCATCNRLRLTSDGRLMPCLFSDLEYDLRGPLRAGSDDQVLRSIFLEAVRHKPEGHCLGDGTVFPPLAASRHEMSQVGG